MKKNLCAAITLLLFISTIAPAQPCFRFGLSPGESRLPDFGVDLVRSHFPQP